MMISFQKISTAEIRARGTELSDQVIESSLTYEYFIRLNEFTKVGNEVISIQIQMIQWFN